MSSSHYQLPDTTDTRRRFVILLEGRPHTAKPPTLPKESKQPKPPKQPKQPKSVHFQPPPPASSPEVPSNKAKHSKRPHLKHPKKRSISTSTSTTKEHKHLTAFKDGCRHLLRKFSVSPSLPFFVPACLPAYLSCRVPTIPCHHHHHYHHQQ